MASPKRYDIEGHVHFVTTTSYNHTQVFVNDSRNMAIIDAIKFYRNKYNSHLFGYTIMPDHLHLLMRLRNQTKISDVMRDIKHAIAFKVLGLLKAENSSLLSQLSLERLGKRGHRYSLWQRRFYDFNLYLPEKLKEKLDYIHMNPVRKGLISSPSDWKYSSFRNYYLEDNSILIIDRLDALIPI